MTSEPCAPACDTVCAIAVMAKASGGWKDSSERALESFVRGVFESLRRGRRVTIGGFGTFLVSRRAERNGRNPRTGNAIRIPAKKVPRFKPSRSLKAAVSLPAPLLPAIRPQTAPCPSRATCPDIVGICLK